MITATGVFFEQKELLAINDPYPETIKTIQSGRIVLFLHLLFSWLFYLRYVFVELNQNHP